MEHTWHLSPAQRIKCLT